jgi:hypothetical protein
MSNFRASRSVRLVLQGWAGILFIEIVDLFGSRRVGGRKSVDNDKDNYLL